MWLCVLLFATTAVALVALWPILWGSRLWARICAAFGVVREPPATKSSLPSSPPLPPTPRPEPELPACFDLEELRTWRDRHSGWDRPVWIETLGTGGYDLICLGCRQTHRFCSLTHGFGKNSFLAMGYTCRRCHRLVERSWDHEHPREEHPRCECGGNLERKGLAHCPNCGSPDMCCFYMPNIVT